MTRKREKGTVRHQEPVIRSLQPLSNIKLSDLQHVTIAKAWGGQIFLSPAVKPAKVLDVGSGSGLWAIVCSNTRSHLEAILC